MLVSINCRMCNIVGGCSVGISIEGVILCEVVVLVSVESVIERLWCWYL